MEEGKPTQAMLCVDDEAIILIHMRMMLEKRYGSKYLYKQASDAEMALKVLEGLHQEGVRVVVVISDWLMPGMKGDEFLRLVHSKYPDISAILVSGQIDSSTADKLFPDGSIIGFFSKPVPAAELFDLVDRIIEMHPSN